jgi:WXXGXW repeat (2 copies)
MQKRDFLGGLLALSLGSVVSSVAAQQIIVRIAPPQPRSEPVPPARPGRVWIPGYWDWRGNRHVWVRGRWVSARRGMVWEQDRWVNRNGRWQLQRGRWVRGGRDSDGDGLLDREDRDRDGDGVRNNRDAAPNNPNRN